MSTTVFTHAECIDGVFAAYTTIKYLRHTGTGNVSCFPVNLGTPFDVPKEGNIIFVDMCPSSDVIQAILNNGQHLTILDHHVSNEALIKSIQHPNATAIYDVSRCGAKLAYYHFGGSSPVDALGLPSISAAYYLETLIDYVDDRDRWTWAHLDSKEITESIHFLTRTLPHGCNAETCDEVFSQIDDLLKTTSTYSLKVMGKTLLKQSSRNIKKLVDDSILYWFKVGDQRYKVAMCETRLYRSDVGNELMKVHDIDFSVCWSYRLDTNEFWLSLRSLDSKTDVSKICVQLGGGGHRNAGGCTVRDLPSMIQVWSEPEVDGEPQAHDGDGQEVSREEFMAFLAGPVQQEMNLIAASWSKLNN
jgi:oligoribonuclease NrnB/cAMP/cGMP phosphodiesterase (DHH superfamily)